MKKHVRGNIMKKGRCGGEVLRHRLEGLLRLSRVLRRQYHGERLCFGAWNSREELFGKEKALAHTFATVVRFSNGKWKFL